MAIIRTQPWERIVEFYRSRATANPFFEPMMILAQQIANSKYASGLYPWTSMQTLCISQTSEADSNKEVLRIWIDPQDGAVVYDFQETAAQLPKYQHWVRRCPPQEAFSRLERFLQMKKWFVER